MINFFKNIWEGGWKGKATIIAGLLILVGAIVGVTYGVVTKAGDEGLMKVGEHTLHWASEDLPVSCTYDPDKVDDHQLAFYNLARTEINSRVEKTLLGPCIPWRLTDKPMLLHLRAGMTLRVARPEKDRPLPEPGETRIDFEDPFKSHPGGVTQHRFDTRSGRILSVAVHIDPQAPQELLQAVWLHEMGHVLGLAHDRLKGSVMYATAAGRTKTLSDKDVKTLRSAYP